VTSIDDPDLEWRDGAPGSARFGDSYFSREGGLEESRAVFLAGCGLPERWRGRALFRVGELGFGTGLNVLTLWDLWRRTRAPGQRLVVVSVEGFPLLAEEAARAHAAFPEIADLAARMRAQWPARSPGAHLLDFPEDGFALTVVHGEAGAALAEIEGAFDAWFLDGFAPARNPDMWRPDLFDRIAQLSAPGARAATFTVAGIVRRGLSEAGFVAEKRPGFGRKKERLEATFAGSGAEAAPDPLAPGAAADGDVIVLGGGIAGCALACADLARPARDHRVRRCAGVAAGGAADAAAGGRRPASCARFVQRLSIRGQPV
jgi:tRNA 5-methylaminomethyl-2-thiouridine biosynthesis bifunctional protein